MTYWKGYITARYLSIIGECVGIWLSCPRSAQKYKSSTSYVVKSTSLGPVSSSLHFVSITAATIHLQSILRLRLRMPQPSTLARIDSALTSLYPLHNYPPPADAYANFRWTRGGSQAMMLTGLKNIYVVGLVVVRSLRK